jgi:phytoene dehydrogenase-like protein
VRYDALVIGAGMSGLGAAIRLAQAGRRVAVLERHYLYGGLNSFYKRGGRRIDSGLHALTNWAPPSERHRPLGRILRQLRIRREELRLGEQRGSRIELGGRTLRFSNDSALLEAEVAAAFPRSADAYRRLVAEVRGAGYAYAEEGRVSARAVLADLLPDPLLREALLLPVCWYGSARENDVDWAQFRIIFQSIFLEGLSRPEGGVKTILDVLLRRLRDEGGELRLRAGVARIVREGGGSGGPVSGVVLDDGTELEAGFVLSSAGLVETTRLLGDEAGEVPGGPPTPGAHSFFETISITDRPAASLGFDDTIVFFQDGERMVYEAPDGLCDARSGVVSVPDNFETPSDPGATGSPDAPAEGMARVTMLANHTAWAGLGADRYASEKERWSEIALDRLAQLGIDARSHELDRDSFTPLTIERFTGHVGGTVYGSPDKRLDGSIGVPGLLLCGTDQGYLGVVGALLSGVTIANRCALQEVPS